MAEESEFPRCLAACLRMTPSSTARATDFSSMESCAWVKMVHQKKFPNLAEGYLRFKWPSS